jgi:cell wall assembly regulator SMI1
MLEVGLRTIATSWQIIEDVLQQNAHSVFCALGKPATRSQVDRLTARLPKQLPRDFMLSVAIHDGVREAHLRSHHLFNFWALLPVAAIEKKWTSMCALRVESDQLSPRQATDKAVKYSEAWVPFAEEPHALLVLDLDPGPNGVRGQVMQWSNALDFSARVISPSYRAWISDLADRLMSRTFRISEWGGIWLDDLSLG